MVKALRAGIDTIGVEHAIPADPGAMDDAVLRQKMSLALPADVVETFFGMWAGTTEYEVAVAAPPAAALDPTAFENEPAIRRVNYDTTRQEQRLVVQGVLFDPQKNALKARFPSPVLGQLLDAAQARAKTFFEANLQKHAVNTETFSGFLQPTDIALFEPLAPIDEGLPEAQKQLLRQQRERQLRARRATLVVAFLPFLQEKLVRDLVLRTVAGAVPGDDALVGVLLQDAALLHDPDRPAEPLLESFTAAGERGVTATYFASVDASGGLLSSVTTPLPTPL